MAAEAEITFLVSYDCPRCHAALEARTGRVVQWLRCPKCGRAGLPPDHSFRPFRRELFPIDDSVLVIGPQTDPRPMTPVAVGAVQDGRAVFQGASPRRPGSVRRIVFASLLFISVTMLMFSALDQSGLGMTLFSALALASLIVIAIPARE